MLSSFIPSIWNPQVRQIASEELTGCDRIRLIEPLDVLDFHNFMAASYLILTDSGGIQEEAPSLGKPSWSCATPPSARRASPAGTLKLVGTEEEPIYQNIKQLLDDPGAYKRMSQASNPYGDGYASARIADILKKELL